MVRESWAVREVAVGTALAALDVTLFFATTSAGVPPMAAQVISRCTREVGTFLLGRRAAHDNNADPRRIALAAAILLFSAPFVAACITLTGDLFVGKLAADAILVAISYTGFQLVFRTTRAEAAVAFDPPPPWWVNAAWIAAVPHLGFLGLFFASALSDGPPRKDWYAFQIAAERATSGGLMAMYPDFYSDGQRFIYPPYAVLFYLPLAPLSPVVAYTLVTIAQVGSVVAAAWLAARALGAERQRFAAALVLFAASASFGYQTILGQNAGTFLLALTAATALLASGRSFAAGLVLGMLAIKPNWLFAPLGLMLLFDRRAFAGMVTACGALVALSLARGLGPWYRFVELAGTQARHTGDVEGGRHNIAIRGVLVGALGPGHGRLIDAIWTLSVVLVTPALLWAWTRPIGIWRKMSMLTLFVVSMNLYVNSYDAVVLLLPALELLFGTDPVRPGSRRAIGVMIGLSWAADIVGYMYPVLFGIPYPPFTTDGLVAFVWLTLLIESARHEAPRAVPA